MDALEMKEEFLILYNKITKFSAPGYNDEEISRFLSKAQERVIYDLYHPKGNKYREGFEETEARRKDLKELVFGATLTTPSTDQNHSHTNGTFFDLPSDVLYVISEEVVVSSDDDCVDGTEVKVKPITHDEYTINKTNPFKKPYKELVWRLDFNDKRHELITDGTFDITSYKIRFIKRPLPIVTDSSVTIEGTPGQQDCLLDISLHRRIVDEAVKIATATTNPEEYQIKSVEQKEAEQ